MQIILGKCLQSKDGKLKVENAKLYAIYNISCQISFIKTSALQGYMFMHKQLIQGHHSDAWNCPARTQFCDNIVSTSSQPHVETTLS